MNKSDWYKILALVVVAVFVFEMIAIGVMNNNNAGPASGGSGPSSITTLTGTAVTNMTIVRYEPYVAVSGNGSAIEEAKKKLLDSGIATYEVPAKDSFVLNLRSGKDVPQAASDLEKANASVIATAVLNTPSKITVSGEGITTTAQGAGFTMQMRPVYEEGSSVPVSFTAYVQNGQLVSVGNLMFLPDYVSNARILASLEGEHETAYVEIAWENRSVAKAIARAANATFKEKSYVVLVNATSAQQNASFAAAKEYATGAEGSILGVRNSFSNKSRLLDDVAKNGVGVAFPPSIASFANDTNTSRAEKLASGLAAAGVGAKLVKAKVLTLKFPDEFFAGGKTYKSAGYEVEIEQTGPISGKAVWLDAEFEALGNKISKFGSIAVSDDQTNSSGATITIGQNGSISINGTGAAVIGQNGTGAAAIGNAGQNGTGAGLGTAASALNGTNQTGTATGAQNGSGSAGNSAGGNAAPPPLPGS